MAKEREYLLSTSDNPFNPWTQWDAWLGHDMAAGHHTLSYLARIAVSSNDLSDPDADLAVTQAIDEIVEENVNGLYVKVPNPS